MVNIILSVISGVLSCVIAVISTIAVERLGGAAGGIIASSPTTILPFTWGLIISLSADNYNDVIAALFTVPVGLCLTSLYLLLWRELPRWSFIEQHEKNYQRLLLVLIISITFWLLGAVLIVSTLSLLGRDEHSMNTFIIIGSVLCAAQFLIGIILLYWRSVPSPAGHNSVTWKTYIMRGILAGISIGVSIAISSISPIAAGIASVFPAITTTTMIAMWISHGSAVSSGAAGPMALGNVSVSIYSMMFALLYPHLILPAVEIPLIITATTLICYVSATLFISLPIYALLSYRQRQLEVYRQQNSLLGPGVGIGGIGGIGITGSQADFYHDKDSAHSMGMGIGMGMGMGSSSSGAHTHPSSYDNSSLLISSLNHPISQSGLSAYYNDAVSISQSH